MTCRLQYVGSNTDRFQLRWNNYKDNDREAQRDEEMRSRDVQPGLLEYFHSEQHDGFLQYCSITLIDKTDGSDPTKREEYWRVVLKTVSPY